MILERVSKLNRLLDEKGLTLTELIITLSLIGLVVMVAVTIMFMGASSYQSAEVESILHGELRLEGNYITEQIRNALDIAVLTEEEFIEEGIIEDYNYVYFESGEVKKITPVKSSNYTPSVVQVEITKLEFDSKGSNGLFVFTIEGEASKGNQDRNYTISSNVITENIGKAAQDALPSKKGAVLKYRAKAVD